MINLLDYRDCKYSTIGNDGIIKYIFDCLGSNNRIFVEFGAWDGIKNSNCRKLYEDGWEGVFIEANKMKYKDLKKNYESFYPRIQCIHRKIRDGGKDLFDNVVDPVLKNRDIDFCSIDIDGKDLKVFETFKKYLPTVVVIEGGQMLHPFHKRVKGSISKNNIQQSLKVMNELFERKGYKILCSYQDSFFIKKNFYYLFDVSSDLLTLYFDGLRSLHRRLPFIQKYNGKVGLKNEIVDYILKNSKYHSYGWENRKKWAEEMLEIIFHEINEAERAERE